MTEDDQVREDVARVLRQGKSITEIERKEAVREAEASAKMLSAVMWLLALAVLVAVLFGVSSCHAAEITEEQAVRAIIGEAANQGQQGMLAVACAIRNRGTLKGVYGAKAQRVNKEPKWVWDMARKAWRESATSDCTNGASHWENTKAFGKPKWAASMDLVYVCKDHNFYRPRKRGAK